VYDLIINFYNNLVFLFERLDWVDVVDILLVTMIFLSILLLLRGTQAMVLLRGVLLLVALVGLLNSLEVLPAFSWLGEQCFTRTGFGHSGDFCTRNPPGFGEAGTSRHFTIHLKFEYG
jgi:DNA integrity scanning protein DisA with diadenylate cyclase activity